MGKLLKMKCQIIKIGLIKTLVLRLVVFLFFSFVLSQLSKSQSLLKFSGYLSELPSISWDNFSRETVFDNIIHNRINLNYDFNDKWNGEVSFRNRLFSGHTVSSMPNFPFLLSDDQGLLDFNFNWGSRSDYILNTNIDRLAVEYVSDKLQLKIGRQRVNWSQSMIWNPNDIFNAYSFFDFDYIERPGMDGIRLQYFTGVASGFEAVVKINKYKELSAATLYRFNYKGYDFQLIAGEVDQKDLILGGGWSGSISGAGFYGEISYLDSSEKNEKTLVVASVGSNYTLKNSLMLMAEYLYLSNVDVYQGGFNSLMFSPGSIRNLSITKNSYVLSVSYPISPLVNVSLAYMGFDFPMFKNYYIGPTLDYSLNDNLSLSAIAQYFYLEKSDYSLESVAGFLRLKWNF